MTTRDSATPATAGTMGGRPAATSPGQRYFATDTDGGTQYESFDGATWSQTAPGVRPAESGGAGVQTIDGNAPDEAGDVDLSVTYVATAKPVTVATIDDTYNGVGTWQAVVVADVNAAGVVFAVDGEDFPRVVWLPADGIYLGDGTFDPIGGAEIFFSAGGTLSLEPGFGRVLSVRRAMTVVGDVTQQAIGSGVVQHSAETSTARRLVLHDDGTVTCEAVV